MIYLKIETLYKNVELKRRRTFFSDFFSLIFPKANPDYDKSIKIVQFWLLEFNDKKSIPNREIGLDNNDNVIMKMPYRKNYGYWLDNTLKFSDFVSSFNAEEIDERVFEEKWKKIN